MPTRPSWTLTRRCGRVGEAASPGTRAAWPDWGASIARSPASAVDGEAGDSSTSITRASASNPRRCSTGFVSSRFRPPGPTSGSAAIRWVTSRRQGRNGGNQVGRALPRQHARRLPSLIHRPACLRPLSLGMDDRRGDRYQRGRLRARKMVEAKDDRGSSDRPDHRARGVPPGDLRKRLGRRYQPPALQPPSMLLAVPVLQVRSVVPSWFLRISNRW
jgi:hypothetical protein